MKKLSIICLPGLDNFLDWAVRLAPEYEVKIFLVSNINDVQAALEWGDIIWLEWANESAIEALKQFDRMSPLARGNKKIVCRLHSYEALSGYVPQLKAKLLDRLIFVSDYLKEITLPQLNHVPECVVIPNGIDLPRTPLQPIGNFENIAIVAGISHKKNPAMAIQIIEKLCRSCGRYVLHWAGAFQEPRYEIYLKHMIKEMNLTENVIFYGHVSDMNEFWKDKDYILSTSVHEGHPYNIMEGMARGLKPVIHNFPGADRLYKIDWLFNDISKAVSMIKTGMFYLDDVQYRDWVIEKGWTLENQVNKIKEMLYGLDTL